MNYFPFDSRNQLYKSVYGAVASNQGLRLRLLLHKDALVDCAFLRVKKDGEENFTEHKLNSAETFGDYIAYQTEISFDVGLYWYNFRYTSCHGEFFVTKTKNSVGTVSKDGFDWQLTVYDTEFKTPNWLKGGIIYQIFPDRFYNSGIKKENAFPDRYYQKNWNALPTYKKESETKFLGNDYYGGDLIGIKQKFPYLKKLGVNAIYLNPIFEAHSNHRYNTANYLNIDPTLGSEKDLEELCKCAKKHGIGIILDGVFSHTGDDSVYFNKKGRYNSLGAYQSENSKYFKWFKFKNHPNNYHSWWGIETLPETNEDEQYFNDFINGENGVIKYWLKKGVKGWRLDVADELPDCFLDNIRSAMKSENNDSFLLGEVWEDASNKISHGARRRFLLGKQLDSVMNYPFYEAIISFLKGDNADKLLETVLSITENYPPQTLSLLMNHIGTHDTPRILTRLCEGYKEIKDREWQAAQVPTQSEREKALKFLKLAAVLQYTLPGVPSLYYGDESEIFGYGDPFCRKTYPWGKQNKDLLDFYIKLGKIRRQNECFVDGEFVPLCAKLGYIAYIRKSENNEILVAINRWCDDEIIDLPTGYENCKVLHGEKPQNGKIKIGKENYVILKKSTQR